MRHVNSYALALLVGNLIEISSHIYGSSLSFVSLSAKKK